MLDLLLLRVGGIPASIDLDRESAGDEPAERVQDAAIRGTRALAHGGTVGLLRLVLAGLRAHAGKAPSRELAGALRVRRCAECREHLALSWRERLLRDPGPIAV